MQVALQHPKYVTVQKLGGLVWKISGNELLKKLADAGQHIR
jgi:hypothetical protein